MSGHLNYPKVMITMSNPDAETIFPPASAAPVARPHVADVIPLARVVSILGIVYVHAWTGLTAEELAQAPAGQAVWRWLLMESFGRSAVPLLGMISGWLVAGSVARRTFPTFVAGKVRTILLPMFLWNALAILLVSGLAATGMLRAPVPENLWWLADELTSVATPNHINVQTPFLRDLFVCMLLAPLLVRLPTAALLGIGILVVGWIGGGWYFPLLLRPAILFFFIVGMLVRRHDLASGLVSLRTGWLVAGFLVLVSAKVWLEFRMPPGALGASRLAAVADIPFRLFVALCVWHFVWRLAALPVGAWLRRFEPYAFLMFCSHLIFTWLFGPLIGQITGPLGSPAYPLYLTLQPLLLAGATLLLAGLIRHLPEALAGALSGGRLTR